MNNSPMYDPRIPRNYYDAFGEKEWTRLSRDCSGELLYHVHMDVLRCYVNKETSVLELGAGAGMFTKELVTLARRGCATLISDVWQDAVGFYKTLGWSAPGVVLLRHRLDVSPLSSS